MSIELVFLFICVSYEKHMFLGYEFLMTSSIFS